MWRVEQETRTPALRLVHIRPTLDRVRHSHSLSCGNPQANTQPDMRGGAAHTRTKTPRRRHHHPCLLPSIATSTSLTNVPPSSSSPPSSARRLRPSVRLLGGPTDAHARARQPPHHTRPVHCGCLGAVGRRHPPPPGQHCRRPLECRCPCPWLARASRRPLRTSPAPAASLQRAWAPRATRRTCWGWSRARSPPGRSASPGRGRCCPR